MMDLLMLPIIDKSIIVFFSGMILSYLEASGYVSPDNHNENAQNLQTVVGGLIGAITIISFYLHHTAVSKSTLAADQTTTTHSFSISTFANSIKGFILNGSKPAVATTTTETTTVTAPETEVQPAA